jgi:hypothetical protein
MNLILGTSCQTVPDIKSYDIPKFEISRPSIPKLVNVPSDQSGAIKALTTNLSLMDGYSQQLEWIIDTQTNYYQTIVKILNY